MDIRVMSRAEARKFSYNVRQNCAIISISDVFSKKIEFAENPYIKDVLRVYFDDVESNSNDGMPISEKDARAIVDFVERVKDKIDILVVHCHAGISRSAGVAAALMAYYNGDDMPIFTNGKYCPNMTCYRTIMNILFGNVSNPEINIEASKRT